MATEASTHSADTGSAPPKGFHGFVQLTNRGSLALPVVLRRKYHLETPGSQVEVTERPDGVLELRPVVAVPANETWFWTEEWQAGERQVDADLAAGNYKVYDNVDEFMDALDVSE